MMPGDRERRTVNGETREWNGRRWEPVSDGGDPSSGGVVSRFLGGAMDTTPFNPMNLYRAVRHPLDTIGNAIGTPIKNAVSAVGDARDVVTGGENDDRLLALAQMLRHTLGAIPLVGEPLAHAGGRIGEGDIAGGAGELAGLASSALLPKTPGVVGRTSSSVGRGLERGGVAVQNFRGGILPKIAMGESLLRMDPKGLAIAAAPYGAEYAGRGMQKLGGALEGLQRRINGEGPGMVPDQRMPNTSGYKPGDVAADEGPLPQSSAADVDHGMPNTSGYTGRGASSVDEPLPQTSMADIDQRMPNRSGYSDEAASDAESLRKAEEYASTRSARPQSTESMVEPYKPNSGGAPTSATPSSGMRLDNAMGGLTDEAPAAVEAVAPAVPVDPEIDLLKNLSPRQRELYEMNKAGDPRLGKQKSTWKDPRVGSSETPTPPTPAPTAAPPTPTAPKLAPNTKTLPRGDDFWGPGSRTRAGDISQATEGSGNPLYDPQTPTSYLRELLRDATDPTERAWLAKVIDQRYRIQRATTGLAGK